MPFDSAPEKPLGRTRLALLADALRRPMPAGFIWDFGHILYDGQEFRELGYDIRDFAPVPEGWCGSVGCAIGLALVMWPDFWQAAREPSTGLFSNVRAAIDMPQDVVDDIFFDNTIYGCSFARVTPVDVANKIDNYLRETDHAVR